MYFSNELELQNQDPLLTQFPTIVITRSRCSTSDWFAGAPGRSRTCDPRIRGSRRIWPALHSFSGALPLESCSAQVRQSAGNRALVRLPGDTLSDTKETARA